MRNGKDLIKQFEGLRLKAYLCPAKVPTIGFGSTFYEDGTRIRLGDTITEERAEKLLDIVYDKFEADVKSLVKVEINENQLGALVSFAYNLGSNALKGSTLLRFVNLGKFNEASEEFKKWVRSGSVILPGLVKRREAERQLFVTPVAIKESTGLVKLLKSLIRK